MSHDTDKLIRQLSLVAFLMAERRAVTARDIKGQVEGYQEMSDEAFARRFYSDRAELIALGVPLHSQRDEYTGEELYNMRSERYFPITCQAQVAWAVREGVAAAVAFIESQTEAGAFDGGVARCRATTRKGKPCQRTPLPERDYCPSHQHLERSLAAA